MENEIYFQLNCFPTSSEYVSVIVAVGTVLVGTQEPHMQLHAL